MGERFIRLSNNKYIGTLKTLPANDDGRISPARMIRIENTPALALIPGSMTLL